MTYSMALLIGMKKRGKAEIDIMDQELGRKKKREKSAQNIIGQSKNKTTTNVYF